MQTLRRLFLFLTPYWKTLLLSAALLLGRAGLELVPPLFQRAIVDEVQRLLSIDEMLQEAVCRNLSRAGRLRQSILQRAFQGRLVPTEMELYRRGEVPSPPEPASALLARIRAGRAPGERPRARPGNRGGKRERKPSSAAGDQPRLPEL